MDGIREPGDSTGRETFLRGIARFVLLVVLVTTLPALAGQDSRPPQTHALLINGGQSPRNNALSHLHHLQDMVEALEARGTPAERIHLFSSDGESPDADLAVRGSVSEHARRWFARMSRELVPGDTLLIFVTDHGSKNPDDPENGFISLWGEALSVLEFRALLGHIAPGVRIVNVMSQCYSGAFADAMSPFHDPTPGGDVCGFYSTTATRPAYGCYPEGRDRDRMGHAFRFIDAMKRNRTMGEAHVEVLVTDATPDVPLRTSDFYAARLLQREAGRREIETAELIDALLARAWGDRGRWEPEIRLLDRLGSVYGLFSPRSLSEFADKIEGLEALSQELRTYRERWRMALNDLRQENLRRFYDENEEWKEKLDGRKLDDLTPAAKHELRTTLLPELEAFSRKDPEVWERLERLRANARDAQSSEFRVEIRLAALLRMRTILLRVATMEWLGQGDAEAIAAMAALDACESAGIGELADAGEPGIAEVEPLPPFEDDLAVVERVLPSWFGIQFGILPETKRNDLDLERGAVVVQRVYDGSAASRADIRPGDLILGPPGKPFDEPRRIREWIMGSPRGRSLRLDALRDEEPLEITISLEAYPTELPRLPAPPAAGDRAPELPPLAVVRGESELEARIESGGHVLFFWATWCAPCKAALPELLAWSDETGIPVVAVSDENPETVREFLDGWETPFPELVATDELRLSYVGYGVSGTPTFVLVDGDGQVTWRQTGYSRRRGLGIADWEWDE